jgi:hypothetical protein
MTRQRLHQLDLIARGLCETGCGRKLASKARCYHCLTKQRARQRKTKGHKPQYVTGLGRPRIVILQKSTYLQEQDAA